MFWSLVRLDAFDDEFGQDPLAIQREQQRKTRVRFWTFVGVALGAGVVGALEPNRYDEDLEGPLWHPVSWLRQADRSSISSFHLADLGGKAIDIEVTQSLFPSLMLVDLSEPVSRGIGDDSWLIGATARENRPGDAGELVGERDCQHVAVQPLRQGHHGLTMHRWAGCFSA
jgi:hypothetical protein